MEFWCGHAKDFYFQRQFIELPAIVGKIKRIACLEHMLVPQITKPGLIQIMVFWVPAPQLTYIICQYSHFNSNLREPLNLWGTKYMIVESILMISCFKLELCNGYYGNSTLQTSESQSLRWKEQSGNFTLLCNTFWFPRKVASFQDSTMNVSLFPTCHQFSGLSGFCVRIDFRFQNFHNVYLQWKFHLYPCEPWTESWRLELFQVPFQ